MGDFCEVNRKKDNYRSARLRWNLGIDHVVSRLAMSLQSFAVTADKELLANRKET